MTPAEIDSAVKNANLVLAKKYQSFVECIWNESEKCIFYTFRSNIEAEQFVMWKQLLGNPYRLNTNVHHANFTSVSEFIA